MQAADIEKHLSTYMKDIEQDVKDAEAQVA